MARFWALNAEGRVVQIIRSANAETAAANMPEGCTLVPARDDINPRRRRHNGSRWVVLPAEKEDWRRARAKKMPSHYDQLAAYGKLLGALLRVPEIRAQIPSEIIAEFEAVEAEIAAVKAAIPKT